MKAFQRATDSNNNRAAFKHRVFSPMALVDSAQLNAMIEASTLREVSETDGGPGPSANGSRSQPIPIFGFLNANYFPRRIKHDLLTHFFS
jgi:hypothetical protein